ncbi:hypothetical protein BpHYR1_021934 [Brachionus plicatilis]|uniref:Uncharacterized protein n=1 Tax=Brachionus plicatilis TaxID=10195 RepID=A0A3M7RS04_BRAPC|nr:hypothetical protein BpHYR1_021934 [Brachionus plicatilis]
MLQNSYKMKSFNNVLITMLDISEIGQKSIFEKFADFSSLEESLGFHRMEKKNNFYAFHDLTQKLKKPKTEQKNS